MVSIILDNLAADVSSSDGRRQEEAQGIDTGINNMHNKVHRKIH